MAFRDNLQHLRAAHNMTQEQLAMLLGVSRQSVTKWEAEKSYPEMDKLLKMCQIFDCSLDDLVQGDLADRVIERPDASVPSGPPTDVCGYDDHQRMMARKIPTGAAIILAMVGISFLFEGALPFGTHNGKDGLFVLIILMGVLLGLAWVIPAGMAHTAFVKAHPFVEDFYTEEEKNSARQAFSRGLIGGMALIVVGIGFLFWFGGDARTENVALCLLLLFVAAGVCVIVHVSMMLGRVNVAEYNKNAVDELELEDIVNAQVDSEIKEALLAKKAKTSKSGAVCGAIMIFATIVGLVLLFAPILASPDPSNFEPGGTTTMWFWLAWPIGGMLCGIVVLLMEAFGKKS